MLSLRQQKDRYLQGQPEILDLLNYIMELMLSPLTAFLTRVSQAYEGRGIEFIPVKIAGIDVPMAVAVMYDVLEANRQVVKGPWAMWNIHKM